MTKPYDTNRPTYYFRDISVILVLIAILCAFFLAGAEDGFKKLDAANKADRHRIRCQEFPHDAVCMVIKHEN